MPKKRTAKKAAKKRPAIRNKDIVESQVAAATRIGCPVEHVKLAKSLGSTAFMQGNRISVAQLTDYLATPEFTEALNANIEDATSADWDKRLKRAKALQAEHKLKLDQGRAWDSEQVRMLLSAGDVAMAESLRRYLESEQPPLVEGKSASEILKINRKFNDDLIEELRTSRVAAIEKLGEELPDDEDDEE